MANDYKISDRTFKFRETQIKKDRRLAVDYWHKSKVSNKELLSIHKSLAKRSNQRLVRLERSRSAVTGEAFDSFGAAAIAKDYLSGQGKNRFSESAKTKDRQELLKDIKVMQQFLLSPTSTVKEQKAIEKKRIETFSKPKELDGVEIRDGIEFAGNKEFYDFLSSESFKELSKSFNSNTIVEAYDQARQEGKKHAEILDALQDYRTQTNQNVKGLRASLGLTEVK